MSTALAGQAPLHGVRAAGIGAAGDDAEVGARLFQRPQINVRLFGRILDVTRRCRCLSERGAVAAYSR